MVSSIDYDSVAGIKPIEVYGVQDQGIPEAFFYVTRMGVRDGLAFNFARLFSQPNVLWVDTVSGSDLHSGVSPETALQTMAAAFAAVADNGTVYVKGVVAEQISAPLGVQGVKVIGYAGGRPRHDDGARWKQAAVAGNAPLVIIHEQGWEFRNILFVPQTGYSAIKAWRAEDAAHPDSSHFIVGGCKFIGNVAFGSAGGIGIEDYGGNHHYLVEDCEFAQLVSAIVATNVSIAAPLRNTIRRCVFDGNTNDVAFNGSRCVVADNRFMTAYHVSAHPVTVNLAYTVDPATGNHVTGNIFADAVGNVTVAKGYKPSTGDVWRNKVTDTAADIVAVPI
jgi:hypothetical protein